MKILWLIDPLEKLRTDRDSTLFLAHLSEDLGYESYYTHEVRLIKNKLFCDAYRLTTEVDYKSYPGIKINGTESIKEFALSDFQKVVMRLEPPVADFYVHQARLLALIDNVINTPSSLLTYSEKLLPTLVGAGIDTWAQVEKAPADGIVKPLDSYAGIGVDKISKDALIPNNYIYQSFEASISEGEHRYLSLGDDIFGEVIRLPDKNDWRANRSYGATLEFAKPSDEHIKICKRIVPELRKLGIEMSNIDFAGNKIIEINTTCPGLWNYWYAHTDDASRDLFKRSLKKLIIT